MSLLDRKKKLVLKFVVSSRASFDCFRLFSVFPLHLFAFFSVLWFYFVVSLLILFGFFGFCSFILNFEASLGGAPPNVINFSISFRLFFKQLFLSVADTKNSRLFSSLWFLL